MDFERLGSFIPPPRERHDLSPVRHTTRASADGIAYRGAERVRSRTLTPPNTQTQKDPYPHFPFLPPHPSPSCLHPEPPCSRRSGTGRTTPGAGRRSAEKPVRSAGCGGKGGGGVPFSQLPTGAPRSPVTACRLRPAGLARLPVPRRVARLGLRARRVAGAAGRVRGAPRRAEAGAGARSPGVGSPERRGLEGVRERLGAHGSVSRGASDLSTTGKASVWAPPPLPPPVGAPHPGVDGRCDAGVRPSPRAARAEA